MNENYIDDKLHKIIKDATWSIQDYIEKHSDDVDYVERLKFILFAVVSSVIEITEVRRDFSSEYLWSELENMAKEGGLTAVAEKITSGVTYSISEIEPNDFASGMNYLGQHVATTLFKHIHDLPVPQRKPEMFLRALESVMVNLINQKFAGLDKHKIVDSFCEHLHMGLNDANSTTQNQVKANPTKLKLVKSEPPQPKPPVKKQSTKKAIDQENIRAIASKINDKVLQILSKGGEKALINAFPSFVEDLDKIMRNENRAEIDDLCDEFDGFCQLMDMIEMLASGLNT